MHLRDFIDPLGIVIKLPNINCIMIFLNLTYYILNDELNTFVALTAPKFPSWRPEHDRLDNQVYGSSLKKSKLRLL